MSRLLHAGFYRLRKNKVWWSCIALTVAYCLFVLLSQYVNARKYGYNYTLDPLFFNFTIFSGIVLAVLASLFIGTEYHDGTIRNKIVGGLSRNHIYLSNFLLTAAAGALTLFVGYLTGFVVGFPLFGKFEMSAVSVFYSCAVVLLAVWAYVSIFTMIAMITSNKTTAAVLSILLAFLFLFIGILIYNNLSQPEYVQQAVMATDAAATENTQLEWVKNPAYLYGLKREIYQNVLDFLPSGQIMQIVGQSAFATNYVRMMLYSLSIIIGTNAVGLLVFRRKNIK